MSESVRMVAALYVETNGVYYGLPDVDPWDEERDARLYAGPWPVVAHPPCARWSNLAHIHKHKWPIGDDSGCFEAALAAIRRFGGVLEHPAHSLAWREFNLPRPVHWGWSSSLLDSYGHVTEVDQGAYGHPARKRTWLYVVGVEELPSMVWWATPATIPLENMNSHNGEASRTPVAFRDVLLDLARSAAKVPA